MRLPRTPIRFTTGDLVTFASPAASDGAPAPEVDREARTIAGLVVPFGPAGFTSAGLLTFKPGALSWASDVSRVKLLIEHDQNRSIGHAVALEERPDGIWGVFRVKNGPEGDRVLDDFDDLTRDGLSVGVQVDGATADRLSKARPGQAVAGSGQIRETSTVSIPAFDDARGARVAAGSGGLVTMTTPTFTPAPAADTAPAPDTAPTGDLVTSAAAAPLATSPGGVGAPAVVLAAAGAAQAAAVITRQPATYTLDGTGFSLYRDACNARLRGDSEAAMRIERFNAELRDGNPSSVANLVVASGAKLGGVGGLATAAPGDPIASPALTDNVGIPASFLPARREALREAIDAGRPLVSRLPRVTLTDATPFRIPREGEFDGVGTHTEGTAHVPAGTLTLNDAPVMPEAVSGYYELSRELADASNPAIDRIALRAMLRDYRRHSEGVAIAAIQAVAPTIGSINTAMELRAALVNFVDDDGLGADFVAASKSMLAALYADVDTSGRPMISTAGQAPTAVAGRAGYTGAGIDGVEIVRVPRLTAGRAYAIRGEGVLFGESAVQQFRFEEVKGPGLICLALWAYVAAAVLDTDDVFGVTVDAIGG